MRGTCGFAVVWTYGSVNLWQFGTSCFGLWDGGQRFQHQTHPGIRWFDYRTISNRIDWESWADVWSLRIPGRPSFCVHIRGWIANLPGAASLRVFLHGGNDSRPNTSSGHGDHERRNFGRGTSCRNNCRTKLSHWECVEKLHASGVTGRITC